MAGYTDRCDPGEAALTRWVMAGLMAAGAIWIGWMLGGPWGFDRIWTLAATAPTESGTFRAEFIVPVEEWGSSRAL